MRKKKVKAVEKTESELIKESLVMIMEIIDDLVCASGAFSTHRAKKVCELYDKLYELKCPLKQFPESYTV